MTHDRRIPVTLLTDPAGLGAALEGPGPAALLLEATAAAGRLPDALPRTDFAATAARHVFGCACCAGRSPAAIALDRLFQQRVRGQCAWFERVVALVPGAEGAAMLRAALREDVLTAARYRGTDQG